MKPGSIGHGASLFEREDIHLVTRTRRLRYKHQQPRTDRLSHDLRGPATGPRSRWNAAYLRLSLSNALGWLVGVPGVAEVLVVPAVVARDRPRMKYQTRPAMIARPMMIQSQGVLPPSVVAGAAGEPDVAGGVAWARAPFTVASVTIVKAWSRLSIMFPFSPQGLQLNVGHRPTFLSPQEMEHSRSRPAAWNGGKIRLAQGAGDCLGALIRTSSSVWRSMSEFRNKNSTKVLG
jgi:hypothetical protein